MIRTDYLELLLGPEHEPTPRPSARFFIYRNLHTGGWSVRQRGKVIHAIDPGTHALLAGPVNWRVSGAGRIRALRERQRNVHAYAVAEAVLPLPLEHMLPEERVVERLRRVTYNPFKFESFVDAESHEPVHRSAFVWFYGSGAYATP